MLLISSDEKQVVGFKWKLITIDLSDHGKKITNDLHLELEFHHTFSFIDISLMELINTATPR